MRNIDIERLTLKFPDLSQYEGQQLVQLVTTRLADSNITSNSLHDVPSLQLKINSPPNANVDWLANQIVSEILRQLTRSLT